MRCGLPIRLCVAETWLAAGGSSIDDCTPLIAAVMTLEDTISMASRAPSSPPSSSPPLHGSAVDMALQLGLNPARMSSEQAALLTRLTSQQGQQQQQHHQSHQQPHQDQPPPFLSSSSWHGPPYASLHPPHSPPPLESAGSPMPPLQFGSPPSHFQLHDQPYLSFDEPSSIGALPVRSPPHAHLDMMLPEQKDDATLEDLPLSHPLHAAAHIARANESDDDDDDIPLSFPRSLASSRSPPPPASSPSSEDSDSSSDSSSSDEDEGAVAPPASDAAPADDVYEVLKFLDRRPKLQFSGVAHEWEYLVRWAAPYNHPQFDTWEPDSGVESCTEVLAAFLDTLARREKRQLKKMRRQQKTMKPQSGRATKRKSEDRTRSPSPPIKRKKATKPTPTSNTTEAVTTNDDPDVRLEKMKMASRRDDASSPEESEDRCSLCNEAYPEDGNEMIFCDGCQVCVHQLCYGVDTVPDGEWYCYSCRSAQGRADPKWRPTCVFCPTIGGAYMRVFNHDGTSPIDGHEWAHVACGFFMEEIDVEFDDSPTKPRGLYGYDRIYKERWKARCYICQKSSERVINGELRGSSPIQCWLAADRTSWFHVLCARDLGLPSKLEYVDCTIHHPDGFDERIVETIGYSFCKKHCTHKWDQAEYETTKITNRKRELDRLKSKSRPKPKKRVKQLTPLQISFAMAGEPKSREERISREIMLQAEAKDMKMQKKKTQMTTTTTTTSKDHASDEDEEYEEEDDDDDEETSDETWRRYRKEKTLPKASKVKVAIPPPAPAAQTVTTKSDVKSDLKSDLKSGLGAPHQPKHTSTTTPTYSSSSSSSAVPAPARKMIPKKVPPPITGSTVAAGATIGASPKVLTPRSIHGNTGFGVALGASSASSHMAGFSTALPVTTYDPYEISLHFAALNSATTIAARTAFLRKYFTCLPRGHKNLSQFGARFLDVQNQTEGGTNKTVQSGGIKTVQTWLLDMMKSNRRLNDEEEKLFLLIVHSIAILHTENPAHPTWKAEAPALHLFVTRILAHMPYLAAQCEPLLRALKAPIHTGATAASSTTAPAAASAAAPIGRPRPLVKSEPRTNGSHASASSGGGGIIHIDDDEDVPIRVPRTAAPRGGTTSGTGHLVTKISEGDRRPAGAGILAPDEIVPMVINPATFESISFVPPTTGALPKKSALRKTKMPILLLEKAADGTTATKEYAPGTLPAYMTPVVARFQTPPASSAANTSRPASASSATRIQFRPEPGLCSYRAAPPPYVRGADDSDSDSEAHRRPNKAERHDHRTHMRQQAHRTPPSSGQGMAIRHGAPAASTVPAQGGAPAYGPTRPLGPVDYSNMPGLEPAGGSSAAVPSAAPLAQNVAPTRTAPFVPSSAMTVPTVNNHPRCHYFQQGTCRRGNVCSYSHAPSTSVSIAPTAFNTATNNAAKPPMPMPPRPSQPKETERSTNQSEREREHMHSRDRDRERERERDRDRTREHRDRHSHSSRNHASDSRSPSRDLDRQRDRDRDRDRDRHHRHRSRSRSRSPRSNRARELERDRHRDHDRDRERERERERLQRERARDYERTREQASHGRPVTAPVSAPMPPGGMPIHPPQQSVFTTPMYSPTGSAPNSPSSVASSNAGRSRWGELPTAVDRSDRSAASVPTAGISAASASPASIARPLFAQTPHAPVAAPVAAPALVAPSSAPFRLPFGPATTNMNPSIAAYTPPTYAPPVAPAPIVPAPAPVAAPPSSSMPPVSAPFSFAYAPSHAPPVAALPPEVMQPQPLKSERTPICRQFRSQAGCLRGAACKLLHE